MVSFMNLNKDSKITLDEFLNFVESFGKFFDDKGEKIMNKDELY
jgi:hypothetical protein